MAPLLAQFCYSSLWTLLHLSASEFSTNHQPRADSTTSSRERLYQCHCAGCRLLSRASFRLAKPVQMPANGAFPSAVPRLAPSELQALREAGAASPCPGARQEWFESTEQSGAGRHSVSTAGKGSSNHLQLPAGGSYSCSQHSTAIISILQRLIF